MKKVLFISLLISSTFAGAVSLEGSCLVGNRICSADQIDSEAMTSTTSPLTYLVLDAESIQDAVVELFEAGEAVTVGNIESLL